VKALPTRNKSIYNIGVQTMKALMVALLSGSITAVASFLIFYGEYTRHFPEKKKAFNAALQAAIAAFIFFAATIFAALLFLRMVIS
jgi:purine-cytosine permease-like protein